MDFIVTENSSLIQAALRAAKRKNQPEKGATESEAPTEGASPDDAQPILGTERPRSMWAATRDLPISFNFQGRSCKAWTNDYFGVSIQIPGEPLISLSENEKTLYVSTTKQKDLTGHPVNDSSVKRQKGLFFAAREAAFEAARKKDEEERPPMFTTPPLADQEIPTPPEDDPPSQDALRDALAAQISKLPPAPTSAPQVSSSVTPLARS